MANADQHNKNRNVLVAGMQLVEQSAGICPIAAGDTGYWNDAGVVKLRNADGTDTSSSGSSGVAVFRSHAVATSALAACTYANGTLGVGATLTGNAVGAFETVDGVAAVLSNKYLITGQASGLQNGYYNLSTLGVAATTAFVLTRMEEFDESAEIDDGTLFMIRGGTTNADTTWKYTGADSPTVGTTTLTFERDSGVVTTNTAQTITAVKNFASSADPIFAKEADHALLVTTTTTAATAGGKLTIAGGAGATSGVGGKFIGVGGAGGLTGAGGAAEVTGGAGGATSGNGGAAALSGGVGTNGNATGGASAVTGGNGQGSAAGGLASAVGGIAGATGIGGDAHLKGGIGGATSGAGGAVIVAGGAATANNDAGGAVAVRGGAKHGSGADGVLSLGTTTTSAINVGAAGVLTANVGYHQARGNAAVTSTVGGGTTGLIPAGASFVTVTSDNADKQISLPAATIGDCIRILVGATACELISVTAADKVNDVTVGATNEAALTATSMYHCQYLATNTWIVIGYTKLGAVQAALVPDAL